MWRFVSWKVRSIGFESPRMIDISGKLCRGNVVQNLGLGIGEVSVGQIAPADGVPVLEAIRMMLSLPSHIGGYGRSGRHVVPSSYSTCQSRVCFSPQQRQSTIHTYRVDFEW